MAKTQFTSTPNPSKGEKTLGCEEQSSRDPNQRKYLHIK